MSLSIVITMIIYVAYLNNLTSKFMFKNKIFDILLISFIVYYSNDKLNTVSLSQESTREKYKQ